MRWIAFALAAVFSAGFVPRAFAYSATAAPTATFTQPFSSPASDERKDAESPQEKERRELLAKIDADIARFEKEGNAAKVAELRKTRESVLAAKSDEELAVWARRFAPPAEAAPAKAPELGETAAVDAPATGSSGMESGAQAVQNTASGVSSSEAEEGGSNSLFDGSERKEAPKEKPTEETLAPALASAAAAAPRPAPVPTIGPVREVEIPRDYPKPTNVPMQFQPPPHPDLTRDMSVPATDAEIEAIARQRGIPLEIFRQAYAEARRQNVDYRLVLAVMKQESRFNPNATSSVGARGLMQVMPATGKDLGVKNANMLYDIKTSIYAGTKYIRQMWNMFVDKGAAVLNSFSDGEVERVKKAIAAYNAGPGNVQKAGGVPNFKETRNYVVKVLGNYYGYMRDFPPAIGPQSAAS